MNEYEIFIQQVLAAINLIPDEYNTTAFDLALFNNNPPMGNGFFIENGFLLRFGERIVCNELYHQLRNIIEGYQTEHPDFFPGYCLQSELKKYQLSQVLDEFEFLPLAGNYSPDLLFHKPSQPDNAFVIEFKNSLELSNGEFNRDIDKIVQFIDRYSYQKGLFICFNQSIETIFEKAQAFQYTRQLHHDLNAIFQNLHVIIKPWYNQPAIINTFFSIINK